MPERASDAEHQAQVGSADPSWLAATVVCPACLTPGILETRVRHDGGDYCECSHCRRFYPVDEHGVVDFQPPDMLLALPEGALEMWVVAQHRAVDEYRSRNPGSVASPERDAARAFGRFIDAAGKAVLDVGAGTDYLPAYVHDREAVQYVAMDPLPVEHRTPFTKVQAWAELMPFATASFDVLLCGTSLDHVVSLESALREMARVLRPGGTLYLWTALYVDPKWFANLVVGPCFVREQNGETRSFDSYRRDRDRLNERIGDVEALDKQYGHLLVDQFHFRHLPVSFVKQLADYGLALRNLEVWEHSFHEGAIFLNAFIALENHGSADARAAQVDGLLGMWSLLAGLTERLVAERQEIGVIREVVASGHRHTELAREEIRSVASKVDAQSASATTQLAALKAQLEAVYGAQVAAASHVDRLTATADQLAGVSTRLDAIGDKQAAQAAALTRVSEEQARISSTLASMDDRLQHLWRAAGLARLLSWVRKK